jgi:hypothetical protein
MTNERLQREKQAFLYTLAHDGKRPNETARILRLAQLDRELAKIIQEIDEALEAEERLAVSASR